MFYGFCGKRTEAQNGRDMVCAAASNCEKLQICVWKNITNDEGICLHNDNGYVDC
jgi:hypothetical protein